jgi:hypothetical protein
VAADADARISDPIAGPRVIAVSIFTGWPVASIAVDARRTAVSAAASLRAMASASPSWASACSIA